MYKHLPVGTFVLIRKKTLSVSLQKIISRHIIGTNKASKVILRAGPAWNFCVGFKAFNMCVVLVVRNQQ